MRSRLLLALVVVSLVIVELQFEVNVIREDFLAGEERPFVPPLPQFVKAASLGYHNVIADAYWLRTIQYKEGRADRKLPFDDLYKMVDFVTELDPGHCPAYFYAGFNIAYAGGDDREVISILEKGTDALYCEHYWKNPFTLAFFYYFKLGENENAAHYMEIACKRHHGHMLYCNLAARIRAMAGQPELGIQLLDEMIKQVDEEHVLVQYRRRIEELRAAIHERDLTNAVKQYEQSRGTLPETLEDLFIDGPVAGTPPRGFRAFVYHGVPPHPLPDHTYVYDGEKGTVKSDPPLSISRRRELQFR